MPKVGVVLRKAYGGGHFAMGGRPTHPDFLFAWPSAELGFMAPEAGVRTVHRRRIEAVLAEQGPDARDALVAGGSRLPGRAAGPDRGPGRAAQDSRPALGDVRVLGEVTWRPNISSRAVSGLRIGYA